MPTNVWSLTTKPFTIFASELLSLQLPLMVILIIWYQLLCQVLLAALDSQVNWTLISENWQSIWFLSQDFISSWLDSPHLLQEDLNNTEPWQFQNLPNRCLMLRTWCVLLIPDMADIWLLLPFSEEECQPKKWTNKCWMFKTKTLPTSSNGFQTTSNRQFVISHQRDWRWQSHSLEIRQLSKKCSSEWRNNSLPCSEERLSSIGILVRAWTRCNSLKLNQTWTTWCLNISNIKMLPLKKKANSNKKKLDLLAEFYFISICNINLWKSNEKFACCFFVF